MAEARQLSPLEEELARLGYLPPPQPDAAALNTAKDPGTALAAVDRFSKRDPVGRLLRYELMPEEQLGANERLAPSVLGPTRYQLRPGEMTDESGTGVVDAEGNPIKFKPRPMLSEIAALALGRRAGSPRIPGPVAEMQELQKTSSPFADAMQESTRKKPYRQIMNF
jgi:hypothetical protein